VRRVEWRMVTGGGSVDCDSQSTTFCEVNCGSEGWGELTMIK
jgi:hypothetical protein